MTMIVRPAGAPMMPGSYVGGLWTPAPTARATESSDPTLARRVAAARARLLLTASPPAHTLRAVDLGSGVIVARSEPIPQATPPADLAERLAQHRAAVALEAELAELEAEG